MDLKLQGKVVVITKDVVGFCNQLSKLLKTEGAIPIIIDASELVDLNEQIKANSDQINEYMEIYAFVNISDSNKTIHHDDILMYFYQHTALSKRLASNFSIVNIGTRDALKIKGDSYQNGIMDFDIKKSAFENFFQYKINTIVHPEIETKVKSIDLNKTKDTIEEESLSIKVHVANTIAILISKISENIKSQIFFIDKGDHLF